MENMRRTRPSKSLVGFDFGVTVIQMLVLSCDAQGRGRSILVKDQNICQIPHCKVL